VRAPKLAPDKGGGARSIGGVRRLFLLIAAVVLVDTMFYAAITPLLPHYRDELGLSKSAAGLLSASYAAGTLVASLPAGWLAIRAGVKPTLVAGLSLLAASSLAFAFAHHVVLLDLARFVQGVGGACSWAGGLAWLVAAAPADRRGELIGSALAAAILGVLLGPVLGGAATVLSPEAVFSGVCVLALALLAWAASSAGPPPTTEPGLRALLPALARRDLRAGFWLVALPALFAGTLGVLAPLRLDRLGASGVAVGAVFLVAAGVEASLSPVLGRLSDRRGRLAPIRVGLVGAIVTAALLPLPASAPLVALLVVAAVAALASFWAPAMALLSDGAERAGVDQGLAFALTNLAWAGGMVLGGAGGGGLAEATADAVSYGVVALLSLLTLLRLAALGRRAPATPVGGP
jgi:MFS family permease